MKDRIRYLLRYNFLFKRELKRINRLSQLSADELYSLKEEKCIDIFRKAISHSPFYKDFYKSKGVQLGDVRNLEDFEKLPVLTKDHVKENLDSIVIGSKLFLTKGYTSGTSGSPLVLYRDLPSIIREQAYVWYYRENVGFNLGEKYVSFRKDLPDKLYHLDRHENALYLSSELLCLDNIDKFHRRILEFCPTGLEGYPSTIYEFCLLLKTKNLSIDVPYIFTSSEPLYDFQELLMNKILNGKVLDWYGNGERSIALFRKPDSRYLEPPLYSHNEYLDNEIITSSLINQNFPLLRYKINDVAEDVHFVPNVSVGGILGRADDLLKFPDGRKVGRMNNAFKGVKNIKHAQIVQIEPTFLEVRIVKDTGFTSLDEKQVRMNIENRIGLDVKFDFHYISRDALILTERGKYRLVVSQLK